MITRGTSARTRALWTGATIATAALVSALVAPAASAAEPAADAPATARLSGVLVVLPEEGGRRDLNAAAPDAAGGETVMLLTDDGTNVVLTGPVLVDAATGAAFEGTVALTGAVRTAVARLAARDDLPTAPTELGEEVAALGASLDAALPVVAAKITTVATTKGKKHTADVMFLGAAGDTRPATTAVASAVSSLSAYWTLETAGQVSAVAVNAVKYATVSAGTACDLDTLAAWDYAAGAKGFQRTPMSGSRQPMTYYLDPARTTHLVVLVPEDLCPGATLGLGSIGTVGAGGVIWARVGSDARDWNGVLFHEFGHNLGLRHANESTCEHPREAPSSACGVDEYADFYDVMSAEVATEIGGVRYSNTRDIGALNVTNRATLGALGSSLASATIGGGDVQTFTLAAASAASGTRGVAVTDPFSGRRYYVEYRSGTGRDAAALYRQLETGGIVANDPTTGVTQTYGRGVRVLLNCPDDAAAPCSEPGSLAVRNWTADDTYSLVFGAGETFRTSTTAGIGIAVTAVTAGAAKVTVTFRGHPAVGTATPTISGTARVGSTLTAKASWRSGSTLRFQWKVGGVAVKGATKATYVPSASARGKTVTVTVTGTKTGYATTTKTSKATATVAAGVLKTATPTISGTVKVGQKLTAKPGAWTTGTSFSYQWYVAGKKVSGATTATYALRSADRGKTVSVNVSGRKAGYTTVTKSSAKTKAVAG